MCRCPGESSADPDPVDPTAVCQVSEDEDEGTDPGNSDLDDGSTPPDSSTDES